MLALFELSGGFVIFKVLKEYKLLTPDELYKEFLTAEKASKFLQLKYFVKFKTVEDAIESAICTVQSKINPFLAEILKNHVVKEEFETLAVLDAELGLAICSEINIRCVSNSAIIELGRCIRSHMDILLGELSKDLRSMDSDVAHGLIRYKLGKEPTNLMKLKKQVCII